MKLQENLRYMTEWRPDASQQIAAVHNDGLERITDHVWRSANGAARTHFVISDSGKALSIDYGYCGGSVLQQAYSRPARRRALLHGLEALKKQFGIEKVGVVLASGKFFQLIGAVRGPLLPLQLAQTNTRGPAPTLGDAGALGGIHLRTGTDEWHTRFAALIGFEADGKRFAHTGDQYIYLVDEHGYYDRPDRHNYVFRNGSLLDGFQRSGDWLLTWRPDIILSGHWPTAHTTASSSSTSTPTPITTARCTSASCHWVSRMCT